MFWIINSKYKYDQNEHYTVLIVLSLNVLLISTATATIAAATASTTSTDASDDGKPLQFWFQYDFWNHTMTICIAPIVKWRIKIIIDSGIDKVHLRYY